MIGLTLGSNKLRNALLSLCFIFLVVGAAGFAENSADTKTSQESNMTINQHWNELFQLSQKEKKGLTFYVNGQTIPGIVTNIIGDDAVEVKNQTSGRIIIRLASVDAVALN